MTYAILAKTEATESPMRVGKLRGFHGARLELQD